MLTQQTCCKIRCNHFFLLELSSLLNIKLSQTKIQFYTIHLFVLQKILSLKKKLCDGLVKNIDNVVVNSPKNSLYAILNVAFPGLKSEVLLHILESNGIYVSTGSACNSKKNLNYVLKAMDIKENVIDASVRFSLSEFNTEEEIDYCIRVLEKEVPVLRKIMR